ncbi:MAG: adenosylcobinamide-phosphate synthase CbiB [Lachnospiraceae bacterium]|nr:adenosylcobinamide-phosphate synthase CbiB [Lachnospiraceae bacterium]MDD7664670.1 adenosylcobinamide-phosphate synthase CbiB [Lachnospiraceae bacterium]MDY4164812.1 adenosylcobinamide-phosphate synthase CbiB [Lachnospiraceae bacterium]
MDIIKLHLCGFAIGFVLDLIVGDPHWFKFHPVRIMGALIGALDKFFLGEKKDVGHKADLDGRVDLRQFMQGLFTMALVTVLSILVPAGILYLCYEADHYLFIAADAVLTCMCLSTASLIRETSPVKKALLKDDIYAAANSLSRVVGRDTDRLSEAGIIRAVIETLAENLSDGIISPVIYLAIFGPCGGMAFKAISTGDSMIGYKNARYFSFGRAAAKADDVLNCIPARISAALIIISAFFIKGLSAGDALRTYRKDHGKTESPNAGCPESAMAGALTLTLGGPAYYGGRLQDRPMLGDFTRQPEIRDVSLSQKAVVVSSVICAALACLIIWCFCI